MAFEAIKQELVERTLDTIKVENPGAVWLRRQINIGPIPGDQKFAIVGLALASAVTVEDQDALMTAIKDITGIQKSIVLVYGQTPEAAIIPSDKELMLSVRTEYAFRPIPPSPFLPIPSPSPSPAI
jgi:hypothetical protein